jgi:hypothetical protein
MDYGIIYSYIDLNLLINSMKDLAVQFFGTYKFCIVNLKTG